MAEWDWGEAGSQLRGIGDAKSVDDVNKAYTIWASKYDEDLKKLLFVGNDFTSERSINFIHNEATTLMLDIAAGTGETAKSFRNVGFKGIIDAIDINAAMLKIAQEKGLYRKTVCQKVLGEESLNVEGSTYDVVTCGGAMREHHIPYGCIPRVLDALKPGGTFVFNSRITPQNDEYQMKLRELIQRLTDEGRLTLVKEEVIPYHESDSEVVTSPMNALLFILKKL